MYVHMVRVGMLYVLCTFGWAGILCDMYIWLGMYTVWYVHLAG